MLVTIEYLALEKEHRKLYVRVWGGGEMEKENDIIV